MEILKEKNIDWSVRTEPIKSESGIVIPNYKTVIRNDNNIPLSVMKDGYEPYQNQEMRDLIDQLTSKSGLRTKIYGYFGNGRKVFVQIKSDDLRLGTDRVEGWVTGINSFDGTTSLSFGPSNITISCTNTFFGAFREMKTHVRHTKNMRVVLDDILRKFDRALEEERDLFRKIEKMGEIEINTEDIDSVTRTLFGIEKGIDFKDPDKVSTNLLNKINDFEFDLSDQMKDKGRNKWGLFSGVTKFTTHSLGKGKDFFENNEKKLFGVYGNRERTIFDRMTENVLV